MYKSREDLKKKIIDSFCQRPEVYRIATFGRETSGQADRYSDIDLVICTNDLSKTWSSYKDTFSEISLILQTFPLLWNKPDDYAEMLMLKGYSPYQKNRLFFHE